METARTWVKVEVTPKGATVLVDGQIIGPSPLTAELPVGEHEIRVEMDGHEPMVTTLHLATGEEQVITGALIPLSADPVATFTPTIEQTQETTSSLPDLVIKQAWIELETGGACDYASTQLGIRVLVENAGAGDAGPFVVEVNGIQRNEDAGLVAGQTASLWFAGYNQGDENQIVIDVAAQVQESNEENNTFSQMLPVPTLPAPCTPAPGEPATDTPAPPPLDVTDTLTPSPPPATGTPLPQTSPTDTAVPPRPSAPIMVREGRVAIPTYPYTSFLKEGRNETYNMSYAVLDRPAYEASNPSPADRHYRTLTVENEYLRLTFLPELGGRLYEVIYKPTGHRETYRNPVLKPSPWGPPEQGWWLAAGGIEWCLPVQEHGYEWDMPWIAEVQQDANGATVILRDTDAVDRVRARIAVRLDAGAAAFTIQPLLENPTGAPLALSYWTNAMLAPGGQNAPSADLRFVLPDAVTAVTVHSRGDDALPNHNERLPWPVFNGIDLSRLGNWNRWLGFFEDPAIGEFMALYDEAYDEGMVRVFPAKAVQGAKGFGFGWHDALPNHLWTDGNSSYVEIHSGPAPTFDDTVTLPAGSRLQWTETWYPVAGLGGLRYANGTAALNLAAGGGQVQVAVAVTRPWSGRLVLLLGGQERWRRSVSLLPGKPFRGTIPLKDGDPQTAQLVLRMETTDGGVAAEYSADLNLK